MNNLISTDVKWEKKGSKNLSKKFHEIWPLKIVLLNSINNVDIFLDYLIGYYNLTHTRHLPQ